MKDAPDPSKRGELYADIALLVSKYTIMHRIPYNEVYKVWNKVYRDLYKPR